MESLKEKVGALSQGAASGELTIDLGQTSVRELNQFLHHDLNGSGIKRINILNPDGAHNIAVGVDAPVAIDIWGHAGYYVAGMNKQAHVTVHGNVGWGVAENMMSGLVRVKGFASESAGASGHGGLLVIEGDASMRCGISMKGIEIVVGGNVGSFSAFMAQAGTLVVCGDAGDALGDSLYEAVIYVRGKIKSLGADAREEEMTDFDYAKVGELLRKAGFDYDPRAFKRVASAKQLYHWNADANQEY
ncbi:MAG: protein glxC [Azospira oryzae]|uniref:Protein glxC n=1 Tax=Pelomicrobium methylotrophicum TaxID=2602750 RepID=A0A5C7EZE5_9PROT|nr:protein glxC [Pelomicrobium methylotrophicum]PZP54306.1 MAG: protein glxC [Azospira oryzae]PZP77226.1 MAG: protein glxC [Azospira oryzae]TXF12696.1 protein glxC [Pelomicrobium methylotrophicum]